MQLRQETIREAQAGLEIAVAIEGATIGRQADVNDDLLVDIPERHVKVLEREMSSTSSANTGSTCGTDLPETERRPLLGQVSPRPARKLITLPFLCYGYLGRVRGNPSVRPPPS
jgi:hypothetical protein